MTHPDTAPERPEGETPTAPPPIPNGDLPPDLLPYCEIGHLVALARRHGLTVSLVQRRATVRPLRHATDTQQTVAHALRARAEEAADYLFAVRPHPLGAAHAAAITASGESAEADAAAWRVARVPHQVLVALVVQQFNYWLWQFDSGHAQYDGDARTMQQTVRSKHQPDPAAFCILRAAYAEPQTADRTPPPAAPKARRPRRTGDRLVQ